MLVVVQPQAPSLAPLWIVDGDPVDGGRGEAEGVGDVVEEGVPAEEGDDPAQGLTKGLDEEAGVEGEKVPVGQVEEELPALACVEVVGSEQGDQVGQEEPGYSIV